MYKGYKIRLYPTKEQEELLWKHIHACRFIWNYMLALQNENYKNGNKYISKYKMMKLLVPLKKENDHYWLNEVSATSLQRICQDLDFSFMDFFHNKKGYPKYKSRKITKPSYPVRSNFIIFEDDYVIVEKLKKIKIKSTDIIKGTYYNPRISFVNNKWILSLSIECENQTRVLTNKSMGIDLGVKELAVVSFGDQKIVFHNINKSKRIRTLEHKLRHIQRIIDRKYYFNNSYEKTNAIIKYESIKSQIYNKLTNIRHNYINECVHKLITLNPYSVTMENINIIDLMKNKYMSKKIKDQGFYQFISKMKYKCEWYGIRFIQVDRYYPSSKICSCCGNIKDKLKLGERIYNCSKCGLEIDRDYNAAINLMKYASHNERLTA